MNQLVCLLNKSPTDLYQQQPRVDRTMSHQIGHTMIHLRVIDPLIHNNGKGDIHVFILV